MRNHGSRARSVSRALCGGCFLLASGHLIERLGEWPIPVNAGAATSQRSARCCRRQAV